MINLYVASSSQLLMQIIFVTYCKYRRIVSTISYSIVESIYYVLAKLFLEFVTPIVTSGYFNQEK